MANAKANASPVKNHSKLNVSDALDTVHDNFVDASRLHTLGMIFFSVLLWSPKGVLFVKYIQEFELKTNTTSKSKN